MSEYQLTGSVGIAEAAQIKSELDALLNGEPQIEISCADLEFIDGSGVQLLLAFINEAQRHGQEVSWSELSAVLIEAIELMAVKDFFQLKQSS